MTPSLHTEAGGEDRPDGCGGGPGRGSPRRLDTGPSGARGSAPPRLGHGRGSWPVLGRHPCLHHAAPSGGFTQGHTRMEEGYKMPRKLSLISFFSYSFLLCRIVFFSHFSLSDILYLNKIKGSSWDPLSPSPSPPPTLAPPISISNLSLKLAQSYTRTTRGPSANTLYIVVQSALPIHRHYHHHY